MAEKTEEIPQDPLSMGVVSAAIDRSGIQDSYSYRAVHLAREISSLLVDEKGQLHPFKAHLPQSDEAIQNHQSNFLKRWNKDPDFVKKFRKFSLPLCHRKAEEMVRATLLLSETTPLTDAHVRKAAICACLTPLRQTVGSCFATAPAILAQRHHLDLFVDDLYELLTAGRLRRVAESIQYSVPFSLSFGVGDLRNKINAALEFWCSPGLIAALEAAGLIPERVPFEQKIVRSKDLLVPHFRSGMTVEQLIAKAVPAAKLDAALLAFKSLVDNALLKAWEFTLASFSDIKMEFSNWNLSWSLGLHHQEKNGIGQALYEAIEIQLKEANEKIEEYHHAVIEAFDQVKAAEALFKQAGTEMDIRRMKADVQAKVHHLRVCEEMRDEFQIKAKTLARFFAFLINQYIGKFQEYFQEIYDPEMPELFTGLYEDRMAGFRLVFKHGRSDSSLWTPIHNGAQFIQSLVEFFTIIENVIMHSCETAVEKKLVEEFTTVVIQHVQTDQFIRAAMARAAASNRLPWSYLSGGTMDQLIPIYFRFTASLVKESREVRDELDLFVFLLETMKALPHRETDRFLHDASQGFLMESATHAFSLLPGLPFFKSGWTDDGFTYTWIRDKFLLPGKEFYNRMKLSSEEQEELLRRMGIEGEIFSSASIETFASHITQIPPDELAAFLYRTLPLTPLSQCKPVLQKLSGKNPIVLPPGLPNFLSSQEIQTLAGQDVASRARELKLAPTPCLFADTNWSQGYFAFVIHPITLNLEVWKTNQTGTIGTPLPVMKTWLGKGKEFAWTIFTNRL